ncbi:MAG: hypothetical protein JKX80_01185 [Candidatus Pacebacteria bacterium]|nr:hypothetical protein [Candidatus Paceibacterota bacterium]
MEVTGLNECNFGRPSYGVSNASKRRLAYNRLPNGTLSIQVNDTNKFNKVMGWIEGVKESV